MNAAAATNKAAINLITGTIAALAFLCVLTVCVMSYMGVEVPKDLSMITTGLVGGLMTMLTKTSPTETQRQPPTPPPDGAHVNATIDNPPSNPVPTTEAP